MRKVFGVRIYGKFGSTLLNEFVLDENDLDRLPVSEAHYLNAIYKAVQYVRLTGESTTFPDVNMSVEAVLHAEDAPRFVLLAAPTGEKFYSRYAPHDGWGVIKCNGRDTYRIIAFRETTQEVQQVLYGKHVPDFANLKVLSPDSDRDVHRSHCCKLHGCKYGDMYCPVVTSVIQQDHPCENCSLDEQD